MKETTFNNLTVVTSQSAIDGLSVGTYFLYDNPNAVRGGRTEQSRQQNNTALRHRIVYCERITPIEYPQGVTRNYRYVYDILESDIQTQETRTVKRRGKDKKHYQDGPVGNRDDDAARDILSDTGWVI